MAALPLALLGVAAQLLPLAGGALLRPRPPAGLLLAEAGRGNDSLPSVHFIYTTGCNDYQLMHSVVLDHTWRAVGSRGRLTRISAGCRTAADKDLLSRSPLRGDARFAVFFAEGDLDRIPSTGEVYPARSRPHAIGQWLESSYPTESVVAMLDPDFVFLKPVSEHPSLAAVRRGKMVSASGWGGYGDGSNTDDGAEYETGPIWLLDPADLKMIIPEWKSFTDTWPKVGDGLMREQFAFQKSAAQHLVPAVFVDDLSTTVLQSGDKAATYSLHYFRSYNYGAWGFHKSLASSGWYADHFGNTVPPPLMCGAPLLQEPPSLPAGPAAEAVTLSVLIPRLNAACRALREMDCPGEAPAFSSRGLGAFGLARTMHPIGCPGMEGERTRYRVEPSVLASWEEEQALGGSRCSRKAQML